MTRLVSSLDELLSLSEPWERLLQSSPTASGFQSLGWLLACWQALPHGRNELHVLVSDRDGEVAGILPLVRSNRRVSFLGGDVSNYSGPICDPVHAPEIQAEWLDLLTHDRAIRSVDFANLREGEPFLDSVRAWQPDRGGKPRLVETGRCPEVDLSAGWDAVYRRHGSGRRSSWRTKWRRLESLGSLGFDETRDRAEIEGSMPDMFRLWDRRWAGRWTSGAFAPRRRAFQAAAAASGTELLSAIRLDGAMIAFCLGVRTGRVTTGYVMAHDDRFGPYSPGLLLLLRILEAAGARGDPVYDFSLGEMSYKALWATGERSVWRAMWGRGAAIAAARQRLWVAARSRERLREWKVEGPYRLRRRLLGYGKELDKPGVPVPVGAEWTVIRRAAGSPATESLVERAEAGFAEMSRRLSPRMLRIGLDRTFHGDRLNVSCADGRELGVAWLAGEHWRSALAAALPGVEAAGECWYDPSPAEGVALTDLLSALTSSPGAVVAVRQPPGLPPSLEVAGRMPAEASSKPPARAASKDASGE